MSRLQGQPVPITVLYSRMLGPRLCHPNRKALISLFQSPYLYKNRLPRGLFVGSVSRSQEKGMDLPIERGKVFVTRLIPQPALDVLLASRHEIEVSSCTGARIPREELLEKVKGKDGLFCLLTDKIDKELLNTAGPQLRVVSTMAVGYDNVDVKELQARGIKLGHTPDVLTDATAELAVALTIAAGRRLFESYETAKSGGWGDWTPLWMCGSGLTDSTVGIVGLGRIGLAAAKRMKPFKTRRILYCGRQEKTNEALEVGAEYVSMDELLRQSDFVLVTCALNKETQGLFNKAAFRKMKKSAIFVNVSRGPVVQQDDLVEALQDGTIRGAGLDVVTPEPLPPDHILFKLPNCVVLPHVGSMEERTRNAMATLAARNLLAALDGEPMPARAL